MSLQTVRVAAIQMAAGEQIDDNLEHCLRMIDKAARSKPALMVLPEFMNHCSWYQDKAHSYSVAVDIDGSFINKIAGRANQHSCYIVINCTVRRTGNRVTGTNILISANGKIVAESNKQVLMGNENNFLEPATELGPVVATPLGNIGMFSCMDGVMSETPRCIALRGAQIMCNTLNSFAKDEASLHIPVRAAENKVFVIAANKAGPLVPMVARNAVAAKLRIAPECLNGAGESQIVDPNGTVLAKAPVEGEHIVIADIDVTRASSKLRPDGTNIFSSRQPSLYAPIATKPKPRRHTSTTRKLNVAVFQPENMGPSAIQEVEGAIRSKLADDTELIVLPELFHLDESFEDERSGGSELSKTMVEQITEALSGTSCLVATSLILSHQGGSNEHVGVLISSSGIVLSQPQLHPCGRHPWITKLGEKTETLDLSWGRIGIVVGGDSIYPESYRLLALRDVDVVAVPTRILESWEIETGFLERAAENRMSMVVASKPSEVGTSAIIAPDKDFTLWTEWERPFDGSINKPKLTRAPHSASITRATVDPSTASNRLVTLKTDVVSNRPWQLLEPMTRPH